MDSSAHAATRHFRAHGSACGLERGRSAHHGYVPAVAAGHRAAARCVDGAGAAHDFRLSDRIRGWPDFLRPGVRSARPQAGVAGCDRALLRRERGLRAVDLDRDADRGPRVSGTRRVRRHRAGAGDCARHLFGRPRRTGTISDRLGDGAGAGPGANCRWPGANRVWLASMARSYRVVARHRAYLAYLGITSASYAGLFAWISGSAFVLQNLYGLTPFNFGVAFALGSVGYMTGSALAARIVVKLGLDHVLGLGGCACAAGGLAMVAAVAFGLTSPVSLVLPVAIYLAGLGMVLPQGIAGAMTPFPERAGAASSLFGFVQQSAAAVCGAIVGWFLGHSAWPLVLGVAVMGCTTLVLWLATRGIRGRAVKH